MEEHRNLIALLRERSIAHGDFRLSSGKRSSYYIDARRSTMSAEGQVLIGRVGLQAIRRAGWSPASVGGLTMGADPVAYAIASASVSAPPHVDAFSVRKEEKTHGARRRIEGNFVAGSLVVVVEDVITTGGSALLAVDVLRAEGAQILGILALVDREEGGREKLEREGWSVVAITTTTELIASAGN